MYRSRRSRLPPLPQSREDVIIEGRWQKTLSGEQFLLRQEDDIHVFATTESLHLLAVAEAIYVDGTFEICPRLFYQVFTINVFVHGQQFPLVYGLLPGKSRETYNKFFMVVKEEAMQHGISFSPDEIMADFELALVQSLELQFPGARISQRRSQESQDARIKSSSHWQSSHT